MTEEHKGIYRARCVYTACAAVTTSFAPIERCEKCNGPVAQVEFRPQGSEGEEETIQGMAQDVLAGLEGLLST